ncbi:HNH endonuclease family protein [Streptomyces sp. NPDC087440]|uniref:HNH endonuclease family protein n=1 Tax=Streptomyces sp. NPDC087440 TaxID=3365790 RepID=UPI0037FA594D
MTFDHVGVGTMYFSRTITTTAAAATILAALIAPAAAQAPAPGSLGAPGDVLTMPLQDALQVLIIQDESRAGYDRSKFRHWVDADKDGCDTRSEVLLEEAFLPARQGPKCTVSGGEWYSSYDNTYVGDAKKLDIDHLVPLAEAWDSGASTWTAAQRQAYANDLGDPRALLAVSAATYRSKADQDPTTWMPTEAAHCTYVANWTAIKMRWQLTIDPAEANALAQTAVTCANAPVKVTLAR